MSIYNIRNILHNLREVFLPLFDSPPPPMEPDITVDTMAGVQTKKHVNIIYKLAMRRYEEEEERRKTVESKCTIFVGFIGVVIVLIITISKDIYKQFCYSNNSPFAEKFTVCLSSIILMLIVFYFGCAIFFAIRGVECRGYYYNNPSKWITVNVNNLKNDLIIDLINGTKKNSYTTNRKVDNMIMAHLYFKRGAILVFLFAIIMITNIMIGHLFHPSFDNLRPENTIAPYNNQQVLPQLNYPDIRGSI